MSLVVRLGLDRADVQQGRLGNSEAAEDGPRPRREEDLWVGAVMDDDALLARARELGDQLFLGGLGDANDTRSVAQGAAEEPAKVPPPLPELIAVMDRDHRRAGHASDQGKNRNRTEVDRGFDLPQRRRKAQLRPTPSSPQASPAGVVAHERRRRGGSRRHAPRGRPPRTTTTPAQGAGGAGASSSRCRSDRQPCGSRRSPGRAWRRCHQSSLAPKSDVRIGADYQIGLSEPLATARRWCRWNVENVFATQRWR